MSGASNRHRASAAIGLLIATFAVLLAADRASAVTARTSGSVTYASKTYQLTAPDQKQRLIVRCPGRLYPLGGGMVNGAPPGADGAGIYPHSYERLGVQRGWHTTAVLFAPRGSAPRSVTMQVACTRQHKHVTPPHKTVYVHPGQTRTAVATCPGRRHLFGGGYQRTDFVSRGGDYVTESRAISSKSWSVTGHAFGGFGGQLTAIAYCWRSKKPLLQEVSASTTLAPGTYSSVNTPACPAGRRLVFGGFSSFPSGSVFLTDGSFNPDGSWSTSGFNHFGPSATVTAYGYCLRV